MNFGYIRVSTRNQHTERQEDALEGFEIPAENIFVDKQSGKDFDRPQYKAMISKVQKGDLIVIKSIDRLGRNYEEILEQWSIITKKIEADIVILDMPLLDTRAKDGDMIRTFVADMVLQILAYVADTEKRFNNQRTREGLAAARARGVRLGRPKEKKPKNFEEVRRLWESGEISAREAGRRIGKTHTTFLVWADESK